MDSINLNAYLTSAIERIFFRVLKSSIHNPKEAAFLLKYKNSNARNSEKRMKYESMGKHIPPFLISSITNTCNLFCKGCYARASGMCCEEQTDTLLSADEWARIFKEASELGVSFNLLAGGEPLLRRDVIEKAAETKDILFPVFTNGTLIDKDYLTLFDKNRNIVPILSIEGSESETDNRRGKGTYEKLVTAMEKLNKNKILFGVSLTVTTQNLDEITSELFLKELQRLGCHIVFYVEYVPVDHKTAHLAPSENERIWLEKRQQELKEIFDTILFLSFPGDEKYTGGCLAAGRGFFHISPTGAAEACPFSPYSDRSLKDISFLEVLDSPFFFKLKKENLVGGEHDGGCTLFANEEKVKSLLN